jgi:hypothetical protein
MTKLEKMLAEGPMTFTFTKKNGEKRKMTATTNPDWIPDGEAIEQRYDSVITVFDLEKSEYRNIPANLAL